MDIKPDQNNLDFNAEWESLPQGEGVTMSGGSMFEGESGREEREERAWRFMESFLQRGRSTS